MIDFKYHITSLVAVFLALGIGILVGSTMVGGDVLVEQQKIMVDQLEEDFRTFREQNRILREEVISYRSLSETYQAYAREIMPALVMGKLTGVKLALFNISGSEIPAGLIDVIHQAGGEISYFSNIMSSEHLGLINNSIITDLDKIHGAIILGGNRNILNNRQEPEAQLIKALKEANQEIIIVAAVDSDSQADYLEYLAEFGIAGTVDNVESIIGQTALVFTLGGLPGK